MAKVKLIPYGISNFKQLRNEDKYYADKTMYLEKLEVIGNFLFLTRPRRFGKSLFLSMMQTYYDINMKDRFDEFFTGLYVHDHPTDCGVPACALAYPTTMSDSNTTKRFTTKN